MKKPTVTIVIPVYNGEDYVAEAIDSALAQTYSKCEVLVINDGSTDNTESICKSYGERIRYIYKENGGVSSALNLAIDEMKGEYFSWLSHDDVYCPEKIELELEALKLRGNMYAPVYSSWDIIEMPGRIQRSRKFDETLYIDHREDSLFPVMFYLIHGCTTLIHKSIFQDVGKFNEELITAQDYDMWFRIFRERKSIYVNKPLIHCRTHEKQGSKIVRDFRDNCEQMHKRMVSQVTEKEMDQIFGGKKHFIYEMMRIAKLNGWSTIARELQDEFNLMKNNSLRTPSIEKPIVLYGAGKNGKYFLEECIDKGVLVKAFADKNPMLWGQRIRGVQCCSIDNIEKNEQIFVTIDDSEEIVEKLKRNGYISVKGYAEIKNCLYGLTV